MRWLAVSSRRDQPKVSSCNPGDLFTFLRNINPNPNVLNGHSSDVNGGLQDMALDPRAYPGVAAQIRQLKSSASTPSLRSRESEPIPMGRRTPDQGGGNVRVVVRVRGFLPRGE